MMSEEIQKYRFLSGMLPKPGKRTLVLLTGARQTGKTTLAKDKYPGLRYINLDAPENRDTLKSIPSAAWGRDIGNAIIDEAQKEPILFDKIKYAYDGKDISFQVMLGSSQILLLKKIRESLAGRVSVYELWPLLMSEFCLDAPGRNAQPPLVDRLFSGRSLKSVFDDVPKALTDKPAARYLAAEDHLIKWGGMPALLPLTEEERWRWLKDYEYTYLERDLADLSRLDDLGPFRKFQKISAMRSGRLLSYSEIARDASVSVDTARRYLEYLRLSYQVMLLQPYYKNITSSVVKTPKLYWLDIGLLRQLTGYRGELTGEIYETMVVGELIKWIKTAQKSADAYFYRTRSGLELDILLETESGIIGIEAKSRGSISPKDIRPMKEVAGGLKKEWRGGIVAYRGNDIRKIAEPDIWAVPSRRLFIS
jgi:predicted AAA+ superfamily ATPase